MSLDGQFAVIGAEGGEAASGGVNGRVIHMFGIHWFDQAVAVALLQLGEDFAVLRVEFRFGGLKAGGEGVDRLRFGKPLGQLAQDFLGDQRRDLAGK